jgi:hypothetical protein
MIKTRYVAALSLLFTALFFIEYTSVLPRTRIPYDLQGFHYPLADYAFQSFKQGRFPQWDPTTYCGLSFVGNTQTAIFYPPMWLMFALKWGSAKLPYRALEYLALAHVWLAFILCYVWLHDRRKLHWLASILGAGGYAFGGYMMNNLQHLGLLAGYAWLPLAFLAVDEAEERRDWRPLWKLALASAMCLLGGYPPMWIVFAVCAGAYSFGRRAGLRLGLWTSAALAASLLFCSVAMLPALESARLQAPEVKYSSSSGLKHPEYYISYFIPNYSKFDLGADTPATSFHDYLYLGAVVLAGLALLPMRKKFGDSVPLLAVLLASLLFLVNFGGLVGWAIGSTPLAQVTVDWDFLAGVFAALAALAAFGLDSVFLGGAGPRWAGHRPANSWTQSPWAVAAVITLAVAWSIRLLILWNGPAMASGAKSAWDSIGGTALCLALIYLFARTGRTLRWAVAAALILLAAVDYKAFGTSKQFNGEPQKNFISYTGKTFPGMNAATYADLQRHREYRWAVQDFGPNPAALRHFGFATPQGFDPSLPAQYKQLIGQIGHFQTNRLFDLNPDDPSALRLLGVGYVIGAEQSPGYSELLKNPNFRLMLPDDSYYKVFELKDAQPSFAWEENGEGRSAVVIEWQAERRGLRVNSPSGGVFRLSEQFYPGWSATLDGAPVQIERCHEAFQCVAVGPGEHLLEFRYRSRWLLPAAALSLCSMLLGMAFLRFRWPVRLAGRRPAPQSYTILTGPRGAGLRPASFGKVAKYARKNAPRIIAALLIAAFFWAFQSRALKSHFGPDEMMNIYGYWQPPLWKVLLANLTFWSNFVRPMAAVYYLPLFHLFELNPVPYTWVRIALLALNTILFYKLALSVSRSWWAAVLASFPVAYQANLGNLSFDGAFIYDTLCATFYFAALLYYIHRRKRGTRLTVGQGCVFLALYVCALNSKEMAVSLPVVVLAYELLFGERSTGLAQLLRRLWPTLAAGAITAVFILGKALSAGSLTAMDAYRPVLTWARFSESTTRFFNTIFYADGLTMEHAVTLWGVLLCAGIAGLVRRPRDPRWMFLWIWVMATPLPIVFLPGRGAGLLYLVAAGWAIAAAMLCRAVSWRLARELFAGRPARMVAMGLCLLGCAAAYADETQIVHRYQVYGYLLTGKHTADMLVQFKKLGLQPKPGSRIVFLSDPFDGSYDMTFLAALAWNDRSLKIFQQSQMHLPDDQVADMDYIIDYTGDGFVLRKPAQIR